MPLVSSLSRFLGRALPNRVHTGLLGRAEIVYGDKVSDAGNRSRRTWKPNVFDLNLYSGVLGGRLRLKVSEPVLKEIDAKGGLDAYLLTTSDQKIFSAMGIELKHQLKERLIQQHSEDLFHRTYESRIKKMDINENEEGTRKGEEGEEGEGKKEMVENREERRPRSPRRSHRGGNGIDSGSKRRNRH